MGQTPSRHRLEDPRPSPPPLSSAQSSSTRIADRPSLTRTQRPLSSLLNPSHHHSPDLDHQPPLTAKRNRRRSFLGTLRSPIRSCLNSQRSTPNQGDLDSASNTHKRWAFDRRRRKASEPTRILHDYPEHDDSQLSGPSRPRVPSEPTPQLSKPTVTDQKGKEKEDGDSASSATDIPSPASVGPSSGSSTVDVSQPSSVPFQSTATDISSSPSAPLSTPSSSPPRDLPTLNPEPALPTMNLESDHIIEPNRNNSDAFNVMERPATPPDSSQASPPAEARRNYPAAGTLVVVQGVVHTSPEDSDATPRRASSVPPPGDRPSRRRFSDLLARPMRSRRSSYAAPDSQFSETSASTESENQQDPSPTRETAQDSLTQEESPVPTTRPLSLSPTSIEVLGTLLSVATAATAASLVSGSSEPLLNSGLGLPSSPGAQTPQQPLPPPPPPPLPPPPPAPSDQGQTQGQSRPLSPTPTAGLASRDRVRNAFAGLRDRLGFRNSPPAMSPVSPSAVSPSPEPEPAPIPSPATHVDPRTQLLADMARAFQMGLEPEDGSEPGSRSGAPSSPAIEVNLGDGQRQQQQAQQQERSPPPEDSFERFLMDLQVDLRRTLEDGRPENESEPEPEQEQEQEQEVSPVGVDAQPLVYPQEAPLSTHGLGSTTEVLDFSEALPALPPDDDDLPDYDEADTPVIGDDGQPGLEEETVTTVSPPVPLSQPLPPSPPPSQLPAIPPPPTRRTVAGSERRPGGGINWWRMYRFPPMVVTPGVLGSSPASPSPPPITTQTAPTITTDSADSPPGAGVPSSEPASDTQTQTQAQNGNTVVPVIVVGLQSVHGYGHAHGHRHTEGRDEHLLQQQQQAQQQQEAGQDHDHPVQDDSPGQGAETSRDRERERRWSTRAADAFRGLRPMHGSGPTSREASGSSGTEGGDARANDDGHGSTTFFIYVIGGYYPPNHQLVIGTDPLDSFEELAELLGQAKPQTVSKEDINKSGLEVIRMNTLPEYEKNGRVAPMCVDRCLICLEDYDPEEDLRLLSCRHVFHKECVDRWLETGRNNCPACRSQGVSNTSGPIPVSSST